MINLKEPQISSISKKLLNGVTGLSLVMFLIAHLIGNFTLFAGPDVFNAYAYFLHHFMHGMFIRIAEFGLLGFFVLHIWSALSVQRRKKAARTTLYEVNEFAGGPSKKSIHSLYMLVSGITLLVFVIIHLINFKYANYDALGTMTLQNGMEVTNIYKLVIGTFQRHFGLVLLYMIAMAMLCSHLMHGIWSAFQSLGLSRPSTIPYLHMAGIGVAVALAVGFFLLPMLIFLMRGTFDPNAVPDFSTHAQLMLRSWMLG